LALEGVDQTAPPLQLLRVLRFDLLTCSEQRLWSVSIDCRGTALQLTLCLHSGSERACHHNFRQSCKLRHGLVDLHDLVGCERQPIITGTSAPQQLLQPCISQWQLKSH